MTKPLESQGNQTGDTLRDHCYTGDGVFADHYNSLLGNKLSRKKLMAEIRRIALLKEPVKDRMTEIRQLIEQYFKCYNNDEGLNANLWLMSYGQFGIARKFAGKQATEKAYRLK